MATDYDTPRKTDDDVDSDSLEELKARLKEDQDNKQKVIDQQVAQTKQEMEKMLRGIERGQGKDPADANKEINALQR